MTIQNYKYWDINIDKGGDFSLTFTTYDEGSTPVDLTGATVSATLREYPEGTDQTPFVCTHNGVGGQIAISMAHEATGALGYTYGWYDVKVTFPNNTVEEVMHGKAFITANVTRPIVDGSIAQIVGFNSFDDFPAEGNTYRIYFDETTHMLYWWNGNEYISLSYEMRGEAGTIRIGTVETLGSDEDAYAENVGSATNAIINFGIPRGKAATLQIGGVITLEPDAQAYIENVGTDEDAVWNVGIPRGKQGFVEFASFEVDMETGGLMMTYGDDIEDVEFAIDENGELQVII